MAVARTIQVSDREVRAALGRIAALGRRLDGPGGPLDAIGGEMVASTQLRFEDQKGPGGVPWPPSLRAQKTDGKTLRQSGRLFGSFAHTVAGNVVEWGTNVLYAAVHQFGARIAAKTADYLTFFIPSIGWRSKKAVVIPPRPFLGVDDADLESIGDVLKPFIEGAIGGPSGGQGAPA